MSADHVAPIEIRNLTKNFGAVRALDGLDLTVRQGEVHGFLGPNGAGKSTTIRVLLGLVKADNGSVRLLGGDPWRDVTTLHRRLAYVPGDVSLWPNLSGGEAIDLLGRLRGGLDPGRRDALPLACLPARRWTCAAGRFYLAAPKKRESPSQCPSFASTSSPANPPSTAPPSATSSTRRWWQRSTCRRTTASR